MSILGYKKACFRPLDAVKRGTTDLEGLPDTRYQASCIGPNQLNSFGLTKTDRLVLEMNLSSGINILDVTFLYLSSQKDDGKKWETQVTVYVVDGLDHPISQSMFGQAFAEIWSQPATNAVSVINW